MRMIGVGVLGIVAEDEPMVRAVHLNGEPDWKSSLETIIKADRVSAFDKARILYAVSERVPHGEWLAFWDPPRKGWSISKVEKWCSVGRLLEGLNSDNYTNLPHLWSALHQVSRLDAATVLACIEDGRIDPEMSFREAKALADELLRITPQNQFLQKLDQASRSLRNLFENGNHQERKDILFAVAELHAELAAQVGTESGRARHSVRAAERIAANPRNIMNTIRNFLQAISDLTLVFNHDPQPNNMNNMKTNLFLKILVLIFIVGCELNGQEITPGVTLEMTSSPLPQSPVRQQTETAWQVVGRDFHSATLESTVDTVVEGRSLGRKRQIVELGTGLSYIDEQGKWQRSREVFELTADGFAVAKHGMHQLIVANNVNGWVIDFLTSDGVRFRSGPVAIGYFDPVTAQNVILATVRNAPGRLAQANEIVFDSAFDGLDASIRVTYRRAGISVDLILHESPVSPEILGLSPHSRLELYTELHPENAEPQTIRRLLREESDPALRAAMKEPDFVDHLLDYGAYKMNQGVAFELGQPDEMARVPVAKQIQTIDNRRFLIEAVEYRAAKKFFAALPKAPGDVLLAARARRSKLANAFQARLIPPRKESARVKPIVPRGPPPA